jgi:hypothetical protein
VAFVGLAVVSSISVGHVPSQLAGALLVQPFHRTMIAHHPVPLPGLVLGTPAGFHAAELHLLTHAAGPIASERRSSLLPSPRSGSTQRRSHRFPAEAGGLFLAAPADWNMTCRIIEKASEMPPWPDRSSDTRER